MDGPKPIELRNLFGSATDFTAMPWKPLREGVDISILYGNVNEGPCAALLRYQPGARIPKHQHGGYEHILVLQGDQSDGATTLTAGSLLINAPGSSHEIVSRTGCIVLAIWERPVVFGEPG